MSDNDYAVPSILFLAGVAVIALWWINGQTAAAQAQIVSGPSSQPPVVQTGASSLASQMLAS